MTENKKGKLKTLRLMGKTAVCIDWANVGCARNQKAPVENRDLLTRRPVELFLGPSGRDPGHFQNFLFQFLTPRGTFQKPFSFFGFSKRRETFCG